MRLSFLPLLAGLLVAACHAPSADRAMPAPAPAPQPSLVIYEREFSGRVDLPPGPAALHQRVRSAEEPRRGVQGTVAGLFPGAAARATFSVFTDSLGAGTLDPIPVGTYMLRLGRIGYAEHTVPLEVRPGCQVVVEVYLRETPLCEFGCGPSVPAHAIITTCVRRAT